MAVQHPQVWFDSLFEFGDKMARHQASFEGFLRCQSEHDQRQVQRARQELTAEQLRTPADIDAWARLEDWSPGGKFRCMAARAMRPALGVYIAAS